MFSDIATIKGYHVEASDGRIGTISDVLFDDVGWTSRWLVVDVGHWLTGRKVLLPIEALGLLDHDRELLPVKLTVAQVKEGPDVDTEQPVSRQIEARVDQYYRWVPNSDGGEVPISNAMAVPFAVPIPLSERALGNENPDIEPDAPGDPHLRSAVAIIGYHIHATDGEIGHLAALLIDDADWRIGDLVVDTSNWWAGEKRLISPRSVERIDWRESAIRVNLDRDSVRHAPRYDPARNANLNAPSSR